MYNILAMKNRKLKFGLGVVTLVGAGAAIPWVCFAFSFFFCFVVVRVTVFDGGRIGNWFDNNGRIL